MKKWISICMIAILLCSTGCQKQETSSIKTEVKSMGEEFVLGQDDQPNFFYYGGTCVANETGYYLVDNRLDYFDWNSKQVVTVCNKPECTHKYKHEKTDCNAYACFNASEVAYMDGYVYYDKSEMLDEGAKMAVERVKADGTEKEKLYDLFVMTEEAFQKIGLGTALCMHRGYVYYGVDDYDAKEKKYRTKFCRRKLEKDAEEEVLQEKKGKEISTSRIQAYGENVYFVTDYFDEEKQGLQSELNVYNIVTKQSEQVKSLLDDEQNEFWGYTVIDGTLYYKNNDKIIKIEKETGKETVIFSANNLQDKNDIANVKECLLEADRTSFMLDIDKQNELWIIDTDGNITERINYKQENVNHVGYAGADEKAIFINISDNEGETTAYYDREELKNGKKELHKLVTNSYNYNFDVKIHEQ